ncbi:MAG TPA: flagellar motor protein MotB, partial [Acidimicrobiales bacterium]|nr:flagellar motor protein MotB [Acidimicrobiales bacterium]
MSTTTSPRGPGRNLRTRRSSDLTAKGSSEDRWLLTYSDMITLLLVLFIVLFAISKVDQAKFREFKQSVSRAVLTHTPHGTVPTSPSTKQNVPSPSQLAIIEKELADALRAQGLLRDVTLRVTASGLVEGLVADSTFFVTNSAALSPVGIKIVDTSADVLRQFPNAIDVAGYTDDRPITSGPFANNWALSAARATTVVVRMTNVDRVDPGQLV